MIRITPLLLLLVGFMVVVVGGPVRADAPAGKPAVKDDGEFFSPEAEQKAGAILDDVARKHGGKRIVIETYNDVPGGKALPEFAAERVRAGDVNGVYVIVVRKGGRVGVVPGEAAKGVFTRDVCDRLREQLIAGLRKGKPNFDVALLETVGAVRDEFDRGDVTKPASATGRVTAATRPVRSRAEQIFDALTGDVPELRKAAADVLRASAATDRATAEAAVPRLVEMLRGSDAGARVTAAELLGEIGRGQPELVKPAVGPLVEALRDNTSNDLRRAAARALAGAGPAAREQAAGALKTAAENDADAGVRQEAGAALKAVEGDKQ